MPTRLTRCVWRQPHRLPDALAKVLGLRKAGSGIRFRTRLGLDRVLRVSRDRSASRPSPASLQCGGSWSRCRHGEDNYGLPLIVGAGSGGNRALHRGRNVPLDLQEVASGSIVALRPDDETVVGLHQTGGDMHLRP